MFLPATLCNLEHGRESTPACAPRFKIQLYKSIIGPEYRSEPGRQEPGLDQAARSPPNPGRSSSGWAPWNKEGWVENQGRQSGWDGMGSGWSGGIRRYASIAVPNFEHGSKPRVVSWAYHTYRSR